MDSLEKILTIFTDSVFQDWAVSVLGRAAKEAQSEGNVLNVGTAPEYIRALFTCGYLADSRGNVEMVEPLIARIMKHDTVQMLIRIAQNDNRDDIVGLLLELERIYYYPGPTALTRIQTTFGEVEPDTREIFEPYIGQRKRLLVWSGIYKKGQEPTAQYELPGLTTEERELAKIDKQIFELLDALTLKVFHAVLYLIYKQGRGDYGYWDMNDILDILDYARDERGYHRTWNIRRVKERLEVLSELIYKTVLFGYGRAEGFRLEFENTLVSIEPDNRARLYKRQKLLYRRCIVRLDRKLYENMVKQKMFAWFDTEFLKLHPGKHSRAILLYSYYACQLSMGAPGKARKGQPVNVVKRNIDTVLRETGIRIDHKHSKKRDMAAFFQAHVELKRRGLIKDFSLTTDMTEITFHESHPALQYISKKELPE